MESTIINDLNELSDWAAAVKGLVIEQKHVLLYGEMGAGKTTFVKALCAALGSSDEVSSPTYALVNEYASEQHSIYHFDLYRLDSMEEILDIGFEEYIDSDAICLIEWPEKVEDLIEHGLKIEIDKIDINTRKISIFKF